MSEVFRNNPSRPAYQAGIMCRFNGPVLIGAFTPPVVPLAGEKAKTPLHFLTRHAGHSLTRRHSLACRPFPSGGDSRDTTGKTPAMAQVKVARKRPMLFRRPQIYE